MCKEKKKIYHYEVYILANQAINNNKEYEILKKNVCHIFIL